MGKISESTKKNILDELLNGGEYWYPGHLNELSFLKRLYNLKEMKPSYGRHQNLEDELEDCRSDQACSAGRGAVTERVWKNPQFGFSNDSNFVRFLREIFHPDVRIEGGKWEELRSQVDEFLKVDGHKI